MAPSYPDRSGSSPADLGRPPGGKGLPVTDARGLGPFPGGEPGVTLARDARSGAAGPVESGEEVVMRRFVDRADAGRQLADLVAREQADGAGGGDGPSGDPVVLGLPRGGVPVAREVARRLAAPLDVIVVRKLGVPTQPELAMGAVGEDGVRVVDEQVVRRAGVSPDALARIEAAERAELDRRVARCRRVRSRVDLRGRTAVLVDDGIATGATARAACRVARAQGATRVVLAAPVAPAGVAAGFAGDADAVVVVSEPSRFGAVGQFYDDFSAVDDDEVIELLAASVPVPPTSR